MRFAKHLRAIGDEFRLKYLDSDDVTDHTELVDDWRHMKVEWCLVVTCLHNIQCRLYMLSWGPRAIVMI